MILCQVADGFSAWFMIDSGSDVDVVSENDWEKIRELFEKEEIMLYDYVERPDRKIRAFANQSPLTLIAAFNAWIEAQQGEKPKRFTRFMVVKGGEKSLIGRVTAKAMKILQLGHSVNAIKLEEDDEMPERFPTIPGEKVAFDVDPAVLPTKNAYYHIPAAFSERASQRIKKMEAQEIIEKVTRAPRWISGMSAVPKGPDDFRLVVNMKGPNRAIRRCYYRLPQLVEIQRKLNGARMFSKLDLTSAFHHVELDEDSRELTTFMAEDGMYRFTRLVFGVNCAPEIFQQIMERILRDKQGVVVFIDDVLVYGANISELQARTQSVMQELDKNNLSLNAKKCEFDKETIKFLGHQLSAEGMNIDETKVRAVRAFREPRTATELRSFLGLASYVSSFVPLFGTLTHALWRTASAKPFCWSQEAQDAFENTKQAIINTTVTNGYFSDTDGIRLYTDASPVALGAVLTQIGADGVERIISFASKTLTATEQRYPQTQREALGIVWAVEHYHYHLRGRHFTIRTDARGIAFIFDRERDVPKRIMSRAQGFALRLNEFSFNIEYIKGAYNIADPSSRLYKGRDDEEFKEVEGPWEIGTLDGSPHELSIDEHYLTLHELRAATQEDETLKAVIEAVQTGKWTDEVASWKTVEEELYVSSEILMKAGAAVVPASLRERAMQIAHIGHPGATAMRSILRERVWWPRMDRGVEDFVRQCLSCTLVARKDPPTPMVRTALPETTWDLLAVDFSGPYARHQGVYILVIVDCFSRYVMASVVKSTDFGSVERVFEIVFKRYGYPKAVKSDNGPPFQGEFYANYLEAHGIERVHSTPLHPQQNGTAERYMQLINKAVQTAALELKDFDQAVADTVRAHNMAKHRVTMIAPEELMFNRKIRRGLPLAGSTKTDHEETEIRERDSHEKDLGKVREDRKRRAKDTRLNVGDTAVVMRTARAKGDSRFDPTLWKVTGKRGGDLDLETEDGRKTKRNVTMVKKIESREPPATPGSENSETPVDQPSGEDIIEDEPRKVGDDEVQEQVERELQVEPRRSTRDRKPPAHLDMYVRLLNGEIFV